MCNDVPKALVNEVADTEELAGRLQRRREGIAKWKHIQLHLSFVGVLNSSTEDLEPEDVPWLKSVDIFLDPGMERRSSTAVYPSSSYRKGFGSRSSFPLEEYTSLKRFDPECKIVPVPVVNDIPTPLPLSAPASKSLYYRNASTSPKRLFSRLLVPEPALRWLCQVVALKHLDVRFACSSDKQAQNSSTPSSTQSSIGDLGREGVLVSWRHPVQDSPIPYQNEYEGELRVRWAWIYLLILWTFGGGVYM
ncbi:hypothetical protein BDP27DRAFT_1367733 [Rhodocollybia butyracea]|uniref:Uncharacterized protein n=1 Tax=Rhodocollybia butyracea TaxID=206335 RepID=A0A9P5PI35_9AGAR|nr:hypothetical protein BDP27DRAFT_1367733 [Rhodocollybia butyracea]